ncbi:NADH:flavin oxidoreductases, Old Yellow Enzyme family [hydrothermal vent metagenome]|uniref:NADH:flavin oxidoreductases, Old Yellow Enzyme family n=1 Tax=hydrothermal vent metagenome TaxID=652676 RepID=A0A3B0QV94_9ZZZZ
MATLFDETTINGMTLRNRMVRSATWEGMCDPAGRPTDKLNDYCSDLAEGGIGLIISGYTFIRSEGRQLPGQMGIYSNDFEDAYKRLTDAVHDGGGKIAIQLVHAGGQTDSANAGRRPLAPSAVKVDQFSEIPAELTKDEIGDIITAFGEGARRARAWGFDGVQLHSAHGYLINQFLSPHTNRRSDAYGGSVENRSRFLLETYKEVRAAVGADYPVLVKLNGADNLDGGLSSEDAVYAAKMLAEAGIDAIEVSAGTRVSGEKNPVREKINMPEKEAYNLELARRIKQAVGSPVMVVGGFRSYEVVRKAVSDDKMDYIAMARPFIREPDLPKRWLRGDRTPAECLSCNKCFAPGLEEGGIYCVARKILEEKGAKDQ